MVLNSYEPGTLCWAKLKGYPWWPSRIEHERDLTDEVLDSKPRSGRVYPVLFFGSLDYAWITPENLEPYEENLAKFGSKAKNRKDPSFADALKQAVDPSIADRIIRRNAASVPSSASEEEDEEDNGNRNDDADSDVEMKSAESDSHSPTRKRAAATGRRAQSNNGRTRKTTAGNKRASFSSSSSGEDNEAATPKRSRTGPSRDAGVSNSGSPVGSARRDSDDSRSASKESPHSSPHSGHPSPDHKSSATKDDSKHDRAGKAHQGTKPRSRAFQLCMQLRHRLQKTIIKGSIPDDLSQVDEVFKKLEDFDMTLELIQETKMGKVMRIIANSERLGSPPEEAFDIKGRASRLAEKWRQLVVRRREGSVEHAAPESPAGSRSAAESDTKVLGSDRRAAGEPPAAMAEDSKKTNQPPTSPAGPGNSELALSCTNPAGSVSESIGNMGGSGANGSAGLLSDASTDKQKPTAAPTATTSTGVSST
ncbi:hypothetical protein H4R99_005363 [Coemansia sp. RSA 1722]|nr:hypothetical protein H4R99_005363 [Coemansia sp. RSA 1722]